MKPCHVAIFALALTVSSARADVLSIGASKDNSLYDYHPIDGPLSNGAGEYLFTGMSGGFGARRALLAFDVAGSVPANATINSVTLTLHLSRTPVLPQPTFASLHRVQSDWGEGASDAGNPGGFGAPAEPGDATWDHTFYPGSFWTTPGGDFSPAASASLGINFIGFYTWGSTAALVADVQSWLDNPATNYGWILIGDEAGTQNARRFDSRENIVPSYRPVLTIDYTPIPEPATLAAMLVVGALALRRRIR